ncbi:MAG: methyltransferase domain-containing protein [Anaerolineae bacterium]
MFSEDLTPAEEVWFSYEKPDELAIALAEEMRGRGMRRVLDVGCGGGRHLLYLAKQGFAVYGTDRSAAGLAISRERLEKEGLKATLRRCDMTEVPFPDEFFDAVLSVYVLHHNRLENIEKAVGEIRRAPKRGGLVFANLSGKGDHKEGKGKKIEPGTYICDSGIEAGMPHHFFTRQEVEDLLEGFEIMSLKERRAEYVGRSSGLPVMGVHWEIKALKP